MSPTAAGDALRQLQHEQSKLLDIIDELRTIGVGGLVELPQLIVCGNQSSGKSSVLEAISRVRFPAKGNVCTRFATEVILRRSQVSKIKISIEPGYSSVFNSERLEHLRSFSHEEFTDGNDLPALIEQAKDHMGITEAENSGFSDDTLKVEISGPDKPELTLVDLPGLYYSTSRQQGKEGIAITRELTERYMKNTRSIILAVISAKTDYHLQEVLNIAERYDPQRERTLGIITQPDILEAGSEEENSYLLFLRNERMRLQLGWHALRNRSFETRDVSDNDRDQQEKEFFLQGRWATISREFVGVDSLRRRLSNILLKHIQRNLPDLISDIERKISDREQHLSKLGSPRSTLPQQRGFLLNISSAFERITTHALNGIYADEFFGGMSESKSANDNNRLFRATIRRLNDFFSEAMTLRGSRRTIVETQGLLTAPPVPSVGNPYMVGWTPDNILRAKLEEEFSELARRNRGVELPGAANQLLVGSLFRDQSKPWEEVARDHLIKTWDSARYFVYELLQHLTDEHTSSLLAGSVLEVELEKMRQNLLDKLDELTLYNRNGHPLPLGTTFLTQIQKARSGRLLEALKSKLSSKDHSATSFSMTAIENSIADLEKSHDEFAAADIVDQMQAYYDVAIITFINNVATLAIENCLVQPLQRIFTSQVVNNMTDSQIQELAAEPLYVSEERERLGKELKKLRAGLRTFNAYRPMGLPLKNKSIFDTASTALFTTASPNLYSQAPAPATAAQMANGKPKPGPSKRKTADPTPIFENKATPAPAISDKSLSPGLAGDTEKLRPQSPAQISSVDFAKGGPGQKDLKPNTPSKIDDKSQETFKPSSSNISATPTTTSGDGVASKGFGSFGSQTSGRLPASGGGFGSTTSGLFGSQTSGRLPASESGFGSTTSGLFGSQASGRLPASESGFGSTTSGLFGSQTSGRLPASESGFGSTTSSLFGSQTSGRLPASGGGFGSATSGFSTGGKKVTVNLPQVPEPSPGGSGIFLPPSTKDNSW
ncbi:P-loop containing nucleoside triphosphate hydrolase protein [Aspergillus granulosus]|uniref:P-loop containing nucleoside triphosphate hydrolase protein n=1 Tax=Aspergillus granulosus TaxID=176169 RepID=A0ABR4GZ03_9EURO